MANDVTWWKDNGRQKLDGDNRNQNEQDPGTELPGDTDAPDIVGRTGEEMPEVAHDDGPSHLDDNHDS
jgi:hypothetical protein